MTVNTPEPNDLDDDDTIEVDADDTGAEPEEEYVPPSKEELAKIREALAKANAQAKQYRLAARAGSQAPAADADGIAAETDKAITKARAEATEEAEKVWKPRLVKAHALAAFAAAGCKSPDRAARLVDLDSITFDDEGNPEGLDDQVEELKEDMPELFERQRGGGSRGPRSVDGGPRTPGAPKKLSATERQLQGIGLR